MPITVTLPDGTTQSFPDGTTEAEISTKLGGTLVPEDPAVALRRSSGIPTDPVPSAVEDALARFRRGGATAIGQTMQGVSRLGYAVGQALGLDSDVTPERREARLAEISPTFKLGGDIVEGAREAFQTDPARDSAILSMIAESAGGMIPTIATGGAGRLAGVGSRLLGGVQYGLSAGEQGAQEAITAGRPDLATPAFAAFAPLGAVTEGLLGVAPRLFSGAAARSLPAAVARGALSESAQEALEQTGQNVIAANVVGYDPERPITQNVAEAALVGGILGGGVSGIADLPNLGRRRPRQRIYESEVRKAGFDLANTVFDPTPKIIQNDRAIAELAAVREQLAAGPNPELEARLPQLMEQASQQASVEVSLDPGTGRLTIHLPAIKNAAHLRDILREEKQHVELATPAGQEAILGFVKSNPLQPAEVDALRAYIQREGEADDAYRARLTDEFLAKLNRGSWWKRWTGEAVAWFKSKLGWELSNSQAGRLVLRNLRKAVASQGAVPGAGVRESAALGPRAKLTEIAGRLGIPNWDDVPNILERWERTGESQQMGAQPGEAAEARRLLTRARPPALAAVPEDPSKSSGWERVPEGFDGIDGPRDDGFLYHVTTPAGAKAILSKGLKPGGRPAMDAGVYREYSAGKVFLTDRAGVSFWDWRIGDHLESQGRPRKTVILRVPKDLVRTPLAPDETGTQDAKAPAYFATGPVELATRERQSAVAVTPEQDREYMAAVQAGDTAKAQRMVDEAAKKAGYTEELFHGTDETRNTFGGIFLTDSRQDAQAYAELRAITKFVESDDALNELVGDVLAEEGMESPTDMGVDGVRDIAEANGFTIPKNLGFVLRSKVRLGKTLDLSKLGSEVVSVKAKWDDLHRLGFVEDAWSDLDGEAQSEIREQYRGKALYVMLEGEGVYTKAFRGGYDSVRFVDQALGGKSTHDSWLVKTGEQVKSADPVTRDDAGNVIPLSQRFQPESPDIRYSLTPAEAYPTAPISTGTAPGIRIADGTINVGPDVRGDSPDLARAVAQIGVERLPDEYLQTTLAPVVRALNPAFADREAKRLGLSGDSPALVRHLLALELHDWRIREASGILPWRALTRLAQALRIAVLPAREREALRAVRRVLDASAEQYRSGELVKFDSENQDQIFVDRNRRLVRIVEPLIRSLRLRLSQDRALYSKQFRDAEQQLQRLAGEARVRQLAAGIQASFNPRSRKFLEEIEDAGVTPTETDIALYRAYQLELRARTLARNMDALESAEASLANIAKIDPRLDVAALKRRADRLRARIEKADAETAERALVIRADRKAAVDRDAAARILEDPQIAEWVEILDEIEDTGLTPRDTVTGDLSLDLAEADNYFALQFDEFAQRVDSELASFLETEYTPKLRALKQRISALKKAEGETEVAMREVLAAAKGKADRSGSAMSRDAMAALREIDAQILRFAFGLSQADPKTEAGKLRDALLSGEVPAMQEPGRTDAISGEPLTLARVERVASEVGLTPDMVAKILRLTAQDNQFALVIEDLFDSSEKAVREHVLTTIELIEDALKEGAESKRIAGTENEIKAIDKATKAKVDEIARRALGRMRRTRNGVRREVRDAERDILDLNADLLRHQSLAGLVADGREQLGEDRPHVRRMVYMAPGKGGEVLAEFGDQPEVRIPPDQTYTEGTIIAVQQWLANAGKALAEKSVDAETLRGLELAVKRVASFVDLNFTPGQLESTLRPGTLLDVFARSWLRTPDILSKLVPGLWGRRIEQTRIERDKAVRKSNAIQQKTATKRKKLILDAAASLGLDLRRRSGDPGILFDAYNEIAHQLRQYGSGVEVGQKFWLRALRAREVRLSPELLNLIRFDRAVGKELQDIEELRVYGGIRMNTGRGRQIVRPSAPTGDIGLARIPKQQPLEDLVAAYEKTEPDAVEEFWDANPDALASHVRDAKRNDLLDERDPLLRDAERKATDAIESGGRDLPGSVDAWVRMLSEYLPTTGPWGSVQNRVGEEVPEGLDARERWVREKLLAELSRYVPLARGRIDRVQGGPATSSLEVSVRDDQNEFTTGAAKLAFPSAWYQYGASDSYRDMVSRITAPATVEYANALDNAAKDLRTKAARIEDAKKQAEPDKYLADLESDITWHTGSKSITVENADRAATKMKLRAQAIEDYASKLRNPDLRTPPLPARILSFGYGALLSTPTSWASNVFGGPVTSGPVLAQFMSGPKAALNMVKLMGLSPLHGLLWEGSPFAPGLRRLAEMTGLRQPSETIAMLEKEGTGASWSRLDAADAEAWAAGQVTGDRARAAYERLKESITGLSNVFGVGRGDVATNALNARFAVPVALKAMQAEARRVQAAKIAGVELPLTPTRLKTREFLGAYGDPDAVLAEVAAMDPKRWWRSELGATLGYDLLTQLNIASASNRPDTNWLVGLLGWTSKTVGLFLSDARLPANAGPLAKARLALTAPTALALMSALAFWAQAGGRAWTKETFAKLSGELAVALSGVPDEDPGEDEEEYLLRLLDWMSDNLARVLDLLHVTWATAPVGAIAGGIARSFQPAARPMPWEQGFWLRPQSQILSDIADSALGGIGFSVTDPSLPAISLLKNAVKSTNQLGRGLLGLADGEEVRAGAIADIKGGVRGAANFLGAWGAALAETVLPGGNAGREARREIQQAARDAGIVMQPGQAPDNWTAPLSLRRELLAAGIRLADGDQSAAEDIRGLASFSWQRAYDRAIENGDTEDEAQGKADGAVKRLLPELDPIRNAVGRSLKPEELAKLREVLSRPAVERDTKAARAVVDLLESRPPARMKPFRASASARSPLRAAKGGRGPKARKRLRLSVPRI